MTTPELFKLIGLDVACAGIVLTPAQWTLPQVEDQILYGLKVIVAISAIAMNIYMIHRAHQKKNNP